MERLKTIKNNLISCVEGQMANLQTVDTKELGEAVDMIKDIEEAIYYCTITKAMNEQEKEKEKYYTEKMYPDYYRDMDNPYEKRYYAGGGSMRGNSGSYNGNTGSRAYIYSQSVSPLRTKPHFSNTRIIDSSVLKHLPFMLMPRISEKPQMSSSTAVPMPFLRADGTI